MPCCQSGIHLSLLCSSPKSLLCTPSQPEGGLRTSPNRWLFRPLWIPAQSPKLPAGCPETPRGQLFHFAWPHQSLQKSHGLKPALLLLALVCGPPVSPAPVPQPPWSLFCSGPPLPAPAQWPAGSGQKPHPSLDSSAPYANTCPCTSRTPRALWLPRCCSYPDANTQLPFPAGSMPKHQAGCWSVSTVLSRTHTAALTSFTCRT